MPSLAWNALSEGTMSTEIPNTRAPSKAASSFAKAQSSAVQVRVKASGKNASRTGWPLRLERVTSPPAVDGSVKSGAGAPVGGTWDIRDSVLVSRTPEEYCRDLTCAGPGAGTYYPQHQR